MPDYRIIVLYKATSDKEAIKLAEAAAKATSGKVDRVTTLRQTWGTVAEE